MQVRRIETNLCQVHGSLLPVGYAGGDAGDYAFFRAADGFVASDSVGYAYR
jgi:hypothetical protein